MKNNKISKLLLENEYLDVGTVFSGYSDNPPRSAHSDAGIHRDDSAQINRIHAFANSFLGQAVLEPHAAVKLFRAKINHAGLDFNFDNRTELKIGRNVFQMNRFGEVFGTTPTTNLQDGFDRGVDLIPLTLSFNIDKSPNGKYFFSDVMITKSGITDEIETKSPSPQVKEDFDDQGKLVINESSHISIVNMGMRHKDLKTKILEPLMKGVVGRDISKSEKLARIKFAAKSIIRRLHNDGKINRNALPNSILDRVTKELTDRVSRVKKLTSR